MTSLAELHNAAVDALKAYQTGPENDRTDHLRAVARHVVAARPHFFTKDGEPDWLGRTYAYRRWIREVMTLANVPASDTSTVQAAVRYHTGAALRAKLTPEQLEDLGLRVESPRERSALKREAYNATLAIFSGGGAELTDPEEIVAALRTMEAVLRRIVPPTSRRDASAVQAAAESVYTTVATLAGHAAGRRRGD